MGQKFINKQWYEIIRSWIKYNRTGYSTLTELDNAGGRYFQLSPRTIRRVRNSQDYYDFRAQTSGRGRADGGRKNKQEVESSVEIPLVATIEESQKLAIAISAEESYDKIEELVDELVLKFTKLEHKFSARTKEIEYELGMEIKKLERSILTHNIPEIWGSIIGMREELEEMHAFQKGLPLIFALAIVGAAILGAVVAGLLCVH